MDSSNPATRSIYITGIHRSGTHWVGRMLACSGRILIKDEEIFNCEEGIAKTPIKQMYFHICKENEEAYLPYVRATLDNRYDFFGGLARARSLRDVARVAKRKLRSIHRRVSFWERLILIEPIGLLSAEWFAETFKTHVLVMIRHPASFVSSLQRLKWSFDFRHLLRQRLLMEKYFSEYKKEIECSPSKDDLVGQGILLWKILYAVVKRYQDVHPEWIFRRQEDMASDPLREFQRLYGLLGLTFTDQCKKTVESHSSPDNPAERSLERNEDSRRNSKQTIDIWKRRLSRQEMERIRDGVCSVSNQWYGDEDWK